MNGSAGTAIRPGKPIAAAASSSSTASEMVTGRVRPRPTGRARIGSPAGRANSVGSIRLDRIASRPAAVPAGFSSAGVCVDLRLMPDSREVV
jgi:hypothetical protein